MNGEFFCLCFYDSDYKGFRVYMEIFFNELCIDDDSQIQCGGFDGLKKLSVHLSGEGIRICRVSNELRRKMIYDARSICGNDKNLIDYLFAFFQPPYESLDVEEKQDDYLLYKWMYLEKDCYGMALAFIMDTFSLSIGDTSWKSNIINIHRDEESVAVRNLYDDETWLFHREWFAGLKPVKLIVCNTDPKKKRVKLRDDHGKKELEVFCERLVKNEYVCEVLNSLEFHSHTRRFIHEVKEDGIVEIVLPWTDKGYGIAVKTTGRNKRETEKIAEILKTKYGHI